MAIRKIQFVSEEFYHIYNRGVDKRIIFNDRQDILRFFQGMIEFNTVEPIGSIYENSFRQLGSPTSKLAMISDKKQKRPKPLVRFVAYCLNPNHYHFLIEPMAEKGVEKFMQRIGTGYTNYFNNKNQRSGALFQGKFKAIHVDSNEYLLHLSAYVNLNNRVHQLGSRTPKLVESRSSWGEYIGGSKKSDDTNTAGICEKGIILEQFRNINEYKKFATSSLKDIAGRRVDLIDIEKMLLE